MTISDVIERLHESDKFTWGNDNPDEPELRIVQYSDIQWVLLEIEHLTHEVTRIDGKWREYMQKYAKAANELTQATIDKNEFKLKYQNACTEIQRLTALLAQVQPPETINPMDGD